MAFILVLVTAATPRESAKVVYDDVRAALNAKALRVKTAQDATTEFSTFTLAEDPHGVVRYFVREYGSSDSSHRVEAYYDEQAKLRFVFVKVGAVPTAWVEARYWLDHGNVVDQKRTVGGEGPTYYAQEAKPFLVRDPRAFVAAHTTGK